MDMGWRLAVTALLFAGVIACGGGPAQEPVEDALDADAAVLDVEREEEITEAPLGKCTVDGVPHEVTAEHFGITEEGAVPADGAELGMTVYSGIVGAIHLARIDDGYCLAGWDMLRACSLLS